MSDWLASYRLLLEWQIRRYRHIVVMIVVIQVMLGLGIVYGLAFLIPHIDATYRTIADRKHRALEGFSMGSWGAAHLAFKHPEVRPHTGFASV